MLDRQDWSAWWGKIKWQFISFKFLSFWTFIFLLIAAVDSLFWAYFKTIQLGEDLFKKGYLSKDNLATIITHAQTTLFDVALSHILLFAGTVLTSVIAIKGVSYYTNSKNTVEAIKKLDTQVPKEDLKQFLKKGSS